MNTLPNTLPFLDQLAMALAYRQYNYKTYCIAHELYAEAHWVKGRWAMCKVYSEIYNALSDESIEALLDGKIL